MDHRPRLIWLSLALAAALGALGLAGFLLLREQERVRAAREAAGRAVAQEGEPAPLELLLPDFALTERSGQPFGLSDLRGKVWIADFVFTTCGGMCPRMTQALADLRRRLPEHPRRADLRLVSISVDPERDTPEALRAYAERYGAGPDWKFLTGTRAQIWSLAREGFRLPVEESAKGGPEPILHSPRFVLVDRAGVVRGLYALLEGADEERRLVRDLLRLLGDAP